MVMKKGVIAAVAVIAIAVFSMLFLFQDKAIEYTLVQFEDLSPDMQRIVTNLRFDRGYHVFGSDLSGLPEGEQLIMVSSGEQPTGGHDIEVQKISGKGDSATVVVKETQPGSTAPTVISYPYVLINAKTNATSISVVDDKKNPLPLLQLERTFSDLTCVYVEQVGSNQIKLLISHEDWNRDGLVVATMSGELAGSFGSLNAQGGDTVIVDLTRDKFGDYTVTKLVVVGGK